MLFTGEARHCLPIELHYDMIHFPDEKQDGRAYALKRSAGQIGAAAAGNDCGNLASVGSRNQSCRSAGAGAEIAQLEGIEFRLPGYPPRRVYEASCKKVDIKAQFCCAGVDGLL